MDQPVMIMMLSIFMKNPVSILFVLLSHQMMAYAQMNIVLKFRLVVKALNAMQVLNMNQTDYQWISLQLLPEAVQI
jgi:hypothetical protein